MFIFYTPSTFAENIFRKPHKKQTKARKTNVNYAACMQLKYVAAADTPRGVYAAKTLRLSPLP